jgi:hypothetical protein
LPEATLFKDVDMVELPVHAPLPAVPEKLETLTPEQVAVIADAGMVVHPENVDVVDCTLSVQVAVVTPPNSRNWIVAADDPVTRPRSGSVEEKLIVAGEALKAKIPAAAGAALVMATVLFAVDFVCPNPDCPVAMTVAITITRVKRDDM